MLFPATLSTAISSEQLLFLRSSVFGTVTSSQQLFVQNPCCFGAKFLPRDHFLTIGGSLGQLLFGKTTFLSEELFRINISTEGLFFFKPGTSVQHQLFQKSYIFLKKNFPEKKILRITYFFEKMLQQVPFQKSYFLTTYFYRRVTTSQLCFLSALAVTIYQ